ncbi:sensor domain-containing diguanylate cyclase [Desulfovibrio sp. TomC]|uniref:sensor domain-containing diguanylate cyclase n=1 Tax=Desulfovibrio sp. TomC TaxID=1562888 RepID=UPI000575C212|nr:diguanylate cyclase [Desulfovibrio sp. TomC]KHK01432.1 Two-component response regulator [Desulfovibrio sp. TomC]
MSADEATPRETESLNKSLFTLKIVLLSTVPIILFSIISITLLIYKMHALNNSVENTTGSSLNIIYTKMLEVKSTDISEKVLFKINTVLDELNILRAAAQQLIDKKASRDIDSEIKTNPWINHGFVYNSEKNWSNLAKSETNISLSVWGYLHDAVGSINRATQEYVALMSPIQMLMQVIGENGVDKGWYYLCGPKETPVMIMTPWAQMPEIFDRLYPGHNAENWWDHFFPGVVEAWNGWLATPDFAIGNFRSQVTVTPLYEDAGGTGLMVTFFAPLWNAARTANFGTAAVDYNIKNILDIVSEEKIGETGFAFLVQSDGNVLGVTDAIAEKLQLSRSTGEATGVAISRYTLRDSRLPELADIAKNIGGVQNFATYQFDDGQENGQFISIKRMLGHNAWAGNGPTITKEALYLVAIVPEEEVFQVKDHILGRINILQRDTLYSLIAVSAVLALLSISVAVWYALQNTRQIRKMSRGISEVGQKRYGMSIDIVAKDDLGELARSFNQMTQDISTAYRQLENYARELEDKVKERTLHLEKANEELQKISTVDGLTQVYNRRHFDKRLEDIWREYARLQHPISLILIDIDYFKRYNDNYGHQSGDTCLCLVAGVLLEHAKRSSDVVARYGGEEFAVITCDTLASTCKLAESMRLAVQSLAIEHAASEKGIVSISLGVSSILPRADGDMGILIKNADMALYESKHNGRDRVSVRLIEPAGAASAAKDAPR